MAGDRLPLPKCSYINTDFPGDDLFYDEDVNDDQEYRNRGVNAGSARLGLAHAAHVKKYISFIYYT